MIISNYAGGEGLGDEPLRDGPLPLPQRDGLRALAAEAAPLRKLEQLGHRVMAGREDEDERTKMSAAEFGVELASARKKKERAPTKGRNEEKIESRMKWRKRKLYKKSHVKTISRKKGSAINDKKLKTKT